MLMMQPYQQSIQELSEDFPSSNPIQVIHHVSIMSWGYLQLTEFLLQNRWNTCIITISMNYVMISSLN